MPHPLKIEYWRVGGHTSHVLSNATQAWSERQGVFVRVTDDTGHSGWGEASPLPGYSSDNLEQVLSSLVGLKLLARIDFGVETIPTLLENIPDTLPSSRFALECALLDLVSQKAGESVSKILGTKSQQTEKCALLMSTESPVKAAKALLDRGVNTAKLKVGKDWAQELSWIRDLRSQLPSLNLRIDVNGAWSVAEAKTRLEELATLGLQFVEQPVRPSDMGMLGNSPTPLAADESLRTRDGIDALTPLLKSKVLTAIVLKPTVLGGILPCLQLAVWAKAQGIHSIASHTFEGPIATAALAEFAIALNSPFAAGVDSHDALAAFPAMHIAQLSGTGLQSFGPGLGVSLSL